MADERWYEPEELARDVPADDGPGDRGDRGGRHRAAPALCEGMRHEWRFLHDLMAESMLGLVTYVQETLGDEGVAEAWSASMERGWKRDTGRSIDRDRREIVRRAGGHLAGALGQRHRAEPGRLHDRGGRGEVHLRDEPLRLGPAALAERARYEGETRYG